MILLHVFLIKWWVYLGQSERLPASWKTTVSNLVPQDKFKPHKVRFHSVRESFCDIINDTGWNNDHFKVRVKELISLNSRPVGYEATVCLNIWKRLN